MSVKLSVIPIETLRLGKKQPQHYFADYVAVEEPLEIVLAYGPASCRKHQSISVTMRTPGMNDFELVLGFLFTEGIVFSYNDISSIRYSANPDFDESVQYNTIQVDLYAEKLFDVEKLQRHFYTSSSCGVCGKASIDLVRQQSVFQVNEDTPTVPAELLYHLPEELRKAQSMFDATGGIHASALFDTAGKLICLREDVGRHNALDKLIGWALKENIIPLSNHILMLSGRISFELVQKASMAGIPIIAAIGAPSSLAIELAKENNITLIGFLREDRMNVYCGEKRIKN
ncbi:MAG: formate dehydrogenase accessory sulfurtransferase FdhD [Saprospiraceae bacterium]